ncbi:MAG: winged helix-turn-helix domain-containing protein [Solirubrobacterales bacterium]
MRAGGSALSLLATPFSTRILLALAEGPRPSERLREAVGSPPAPTMRSHLQALTRRGLLRRSERGDAKGTVTYDLAGSGQDLLQVGEALAAWLAAGPAGPLELGSEVAAAAIRALVEAWAVNLVRIVASQPCSVDELAKLIQELDRAALQRRLATLLQLGLLEETAFEDHSSPRHAPTAWLRRSVGPLAAGASWERRHLPTATTPIDRYDVETAFLLTVPLLHLRAERSGRCRLAVELPDGAGEATPVGVLVDVSEGEVARCATRLAGAAQAWVAGSPRAWLLAVIEGDLSGLQLAGEEDLATDIVWAIHAELFDSPPPG